MDEKQPETSHFYIKFSRKFQKGGVTRFRTMDIQYGGHLPKWLLSMHLEMGKWIKAS